MNSLSDLISKLSDNSIMLLYFNNDLLGVRFKVYDLSEDKYNYFDIDTDLLKEDKAIYSDVKTSKRAGKTNLVNKNGRYYTEDELQNGYDITEISTLDQLRKYYKSDLSSIGNLTLTTKCGNAYAISSDNSEEVEALTTDSIEQALHLGIKFEGATLDTDGKVHFDESIPVFDMSQFSNIGSDDEDDFEDDYEEDFEEDAEEDFEDDEYEDDDFDDDYEDDSFDEEEEAIDDDSEEDDDFEDDYEDDFYGEEENPYAEEGGINKLYEYLSKEQVQALQKYYLWYSRYIFKNAVPDPNWGFKDTKKLALKKQKIASLKGIDITWQYGGFVDTGCFRGGYCTLDHPLRYMHLAINADNITFDHMFWNDHIDDDIYEIIESEDCIVFGVKCVTDFFNVSSEVVRELNRIQRDCIRDMDEIYNFYAAGMQDEAKQSFKTMDTILRKIKLYDIKNIGKKDYVPLVNPELIALYLNMRNLDVVPPKSLVQSLRDEIIGWSSHKFSGGMRLLNYDKLEEQWKKLYPKQDIGGISDFFTRHRVDGVRYNNWLIDYLSSVLTKWYMLSSCGVYEYNAETNKDEGGASKKAKSDLYTIEVRYGKFCNPSTKEDYEFSYAELEAIFKYYSLRKQYGNVFIYSYIFRDLRNYLDLEDADTSYNEAFRKLDNDFRGKKVTELIPILESNIAEIDKNVASIKAKFSDYFANLYRGYKSHSVPTGVLDSVVKEINDTFKIDIQFNEEVDVIEDTAWYLKHKGLFIQAIKNCHYMNEVSEKELQDVEREYILREHSGRKTYNEYKRLVEVDNEKGSQDDEGTIESNEGGNKGTTVSDEGGNEGTTTPEAGGNDNTTVPNDTGITVSKDVALQWVYDNPLQKVSNDYYSKVAKTVKSRLECSDRQLPYVLQYYELCTGNKVEGLELPKKSFTPLEPDSLYAKAIDFIIESGEEGMYVNVCKSVKKYNRYTEKQEKYIKQAVEKYKASQN